MANLNYATLHSLAGGGSAWRISKTITDTSTTIYICACSFVTRARVSSVLFRSNWVDVTAYYYNGSTWVQAYAPRGNNGHTVYASGKKDAEWKLYHNRSAEGTTSGDQHMYHLWKYVVQMRGKDGSAHGYFDYWIGGIEMMTEAEYNSYFRYKPIKFCNNSDATGVNDTTFPQIYRPSGKRGTAITSANASQCCATDID